MVTYLHDKSTDGWNITTLSTTFRFTIVIANYKVLFKTDKTDMNSGNKIIQDEVMVNFNGKHYSECHLFTVICYTFSVTFC